ncbi:hypothetical protein HDV05_005594 [Chytridiales sp. JEL 0842]|nr:hypothetical protein HDV05_005594 [Chytridiales sp. JEL 0842]
MNPPATPTDFTSNQQKNAQLIPDLASTASQKTFQLLRSAMLSSTHPLPLLESFNHAARDKYTDLALYIESLLKPVDGGGGEGEAVSWEEMEGLVHQVTEVERQVGKLEALAGELEEYSKGLEERVKRRLRAAAAGS